MTELTVVSPKEPAALTAPLAAADAASSARMPTLFALSMADSTAFRATLATSPPTSAVPLISPRVLSSMARVRLPPIWWAPVTVPLIVSLAVAPRSPPISVEPWIAPLAALKAASWTRIVTLPVASMAPSTAFRVTDATSPPTSEAPLISPRVLSSMASMTLPRFPECR